MLKWLVVGFVLGKYYEREKTKGVSQGEILKGAATAALNPAGAIVSEIPKEWLDVEG